MTILAVVLYTSVIVVALLLIAVILVQQSKGGGFGGAFGGLGESILGAQAGTHLSKFTVILSVIFFSLVLLLAVLVSQKMVISNSDSEINKLIENKVETAKGVATKALPAKK